MTVQQSREALSERKTAQLRPLLLDLLVVRVKTYHIPHRLEVIVALILSMSQILVLFFSYIRVVY